MYTSQGGRLDLNDPGILKLENSGLWRRRKMTAIFKAAAEAAAAAPATAAAAPAPAPNTGSLPKLQGL